MLRLKYCYQTQKEKKNAVVEIKFADFVSGYKTCKIPTMWFKPKTTLSLYEDFRKRSLETGDAKPFTSRVGYTDSGIGLDWKYKNYLRERETTFI